MPESPAPESMKVNSPWPVTQGRNPYLHNVFVLLQFNPDKSQKEYDRTQSDAVKKINSRVEWIVHGQSVTSVDASRAEQIARQETDFVSERLLAHTHHEVDTKVFQEAIKQLEAIPLEDAKSLLPLPVRDLTEIARRLPPHPEMLAGESRQFPRERLLELFRISQQAEQIFDL